MLMELMMWIITLMIISEFGWIMFNSIKLFPLMSKINMHVYTKT